MVLPVLEVLLLVAVTALGMFSLVRPLWWLPYSTWLLPVELRRDFENRAAPRLGVRLYWLFGLIGSIPYNAVRFTFARDLVGPEALEITCRLQFGAFGLVGAVFAVYLALNSAFLLIRPHAALRSSWTSPNFISPRWGRISEESRIPTTLRLFTLLTFVLGAGGTYVATVALIESINSPGCYL